MACISASVSGTSVTECSVSITTQSNPQVASNASATTDPGMEFHSPICCRPSVSPA